MRRRDMLKRAVGASLRWLKQDGQELAGLALLGVGLWWWWPPACPMVLGVLLLGSVLMRK